MILVSSCLLGLNVKYNGESNAHPLLMQYSYLGKYIPICPEQLGGLPTPRSPLEIEEGSGEDVLKLQKRVINKQGEDFTAQFLKGAEQALMIARTFPVKAAILKERSPSCGVHQIYNGNFNHTLKKGKGVTAALLCKYGIPIYSETELKEGLLKKLLSLE